MHKSRLGVAWEGYALREKYSSVLCQLRQEAATVVYLLIIKVMLALILYQSHSPYDMLESIKKEVEGDLENVFLKLVQCIRNKPLYFADRLYVPVNGKGSRAKVLIRIPCSDMDMLKIRSDFKSSSASLCTTAFSRTPRATARKHCCSCVVGVTEPHNIRASRVAVLCSS
ncbi:unnamed protein product [Rangifer tarandus platyrhynchus]|uniref:Uncharacterized protein n=2 Tax=Rangifer tarandus platyrhynchus TaxID=3082113 RepID=A0ABN8YDS0_RANTA|nr:unnamed protein product [Rangifer tarandus platyrhynchus]CAI9699674.1 unnamed protein product [Rangifer tarandus platyrhynchus]